MLLGGDGKSRRPSCVRQPRAIEQIQSQDIARVELKLSSEVDLSDLLRPEIYESYELVA